MKGKVQRKPGSPRIRSRRHLFRDRHASSPSSTSSAANFTQTCTFDNFVLSEHPLLDVRSTATSLFQPCLRGTRISPFLSLRDTCD